MQPPSPAKSLELDGAYFGTTFPHLFLQTYPRYYPKKDANKEEKFVPRIFGYKLHPSSKEYVELLSSLTFQRVTQERRRKRRDDTRVEQATKST